MGCQPSVLTLISKGASIVALAIKENLLDDKFLTRTTGDYHLSKSLPISTKKFKSILMDKLGFRFNEQELIVSRERVKDFKLWLE